MNSDGSDKKLFLSAGRVVGTPQWSPDRSRIVYISYMPYRTLRVIDADGTAVRTVADHHQDVGQDYGWSPDGSEIVSTVRYGTAHSQIWKVDADGEHATQLTDGDALDGSPLWAPDGTQIAFVRLSSRDEGFQIYVMNAEGSDERKLTFLTETDDTTWYTDVVDWSPDGSKVMYLASYGDLWVMDRDGGNQTPLTTSSQRVHLGAQFSPDGTKIALTRINLKSYRTNVFVMDADGTDMDTLAPVTRYEWFADWSPAGERVLLHQERPRGQVGLVTVDMDDLEEVRLTPRRGRWADSAWR